MSDESFWALYTLGVLSHFKLWRMLFEANSETKKHKTSSIYVALFGSILWPVMVALAIILSIFMRKKEKLSDEDMFEPR